MGTNASATAVPDVAAQSRADGPAGPGPCGPAGRRPAPRTTGPPPRRLEDLARGVAQLCLEVEAARRPVALLAPLLDRRLICQLERGWVRGAATPGRVVSVSGRLVAADCYEAVAVVCRGERFGALALQLRRRHERWVITEAVRPEDGPHAPLPYSVDDEPDEPDELDLLLEAEMARNTVGWPVGAPEPLPLA